MSLEDLRRRAILISLPERQSHRRAPGSGVVEQARCCVAESEGLSLGRE